jgi:hypothetical protein
MAHPRTILLAAIGVAVLGVAPAAAKAPAKVVDDLSRARATDVATRVAQLPKPLRTALAKSFRQRALFIADAGQPFQVTDFIIIRPGQKELPFRRLIFAFRADRHFLVYYQMGGYGQSLSALVFSAPIRGRCEFIWGGVELDYEKPAKTPADLIRRIVRHKLMDHLPFYW